jgi:glycosyltransferase involved in cell wall biosynthesis
VIVAFDAQLTVGTATGAGVYQRDLAAALSAQGVDVRVLRAPWLDPWRFDRRVLWDQVLLPLAVARSGATLLHATSGTVPLVRGIPTVVTVHDLAWLRVQAHARGYARVYFGTLHQRAYRSAAAIVCDSAFSAAEYRALVEPDRAVEVIFPGVDDRFARIERAPREPPFALVVGTVEARKNLLAVVEALPQLPSLRVVSIGPFTPYAERVQARARELGVASRLDLRGYVAAPERDDLYARATLAVVPSRYEGFGYALAEAMCAGLPAVAARASALPELAGDGVALVEPDDTAGWVAAIGTVLADRAAAEARAAAARAEAVARFAWSLAAERMRTVYARVAEG